MLTASFDYRLPPGRIAQAPLAGRDSSRLLHLSPHAAISNHVFRALPELLRPGDLLVANETRVRRARLGGRDERGRSAELLVLDRLGDDTYACLTRPAKQLRSGAQLALSDGLRAVVVGQSEAHPGARTIRFDGGDGDVERTIERLGEVPLPPYIRGWHGDGERYQTVYAAGPPASAAAPTAGLHFTDTVLAAARRRGIGWATVRLDVGLATFSPIRSDTVEGHVMHRERYTVPAGAASAIERTRATGGRVIAVGTTVVRALESCVRDDGTLRTGDGEASVFIRPGHRFRAVDGLLTNFHQPRSSLLVLLAAFTGDSWRCAYEHALRSGYRFLSFGDCMLCWRSA